MSLGLVLDGPFKPSSVSGHCCQLVQVDEEENHNMSCPQHGCDLLSRQTVADEQTWTLKIVERFALNVFSPQSNPTKQGR